MSDKDKTGGSKDHKKVGEEEEETNWRREEEKRRRRMKENFTLEEKEINLFEGNLMQK